MRLVGTLLAEQDDEWRFSDRRCFSIGSMAKVDELERGEDNQRFAPRGTRGPFVNRGVA